MEIILGKQGTQHFPIENGSVSRRHARLTQTADERLLLEDLQSTNGTFVQREDGTFQRVERMEIGEFTRICLGPPTAAGFYFYAHHALAPASEGYEAEMRYVLDVNQALEEEKRRVEAEVAGRSRFVSFLPAIILFVGMVVLTILLPEYSKYTMFLGCSGTLLAGIFSSRLQKQSARVKAIEERRKRLVRCPKCNRLLSPIDISGEQCAACKTHS